MPAMIDIIGLVIGLILVGYLIFSIVRPEKF
jgi:K+-transporting ATPase KdpF subunit